MPRHQLTEQERSRGGHARVAKIREQRAAAREIADERLVAQVGKALARLEALLDSEEGHVAFRAVREVLDRVHGRPVARLEHAGPSGGETIKILVHPSLAFDFSTMSDDELDRLEDLLHKAKRVKA